MKFWTILLVTLGTLAIASIGITMYYGIFDSTNAFAAIVPVLAYSAGYLYIKYISEQKRLQDQKKRNFDYCWSKMNELLSRMPGGDRVSWLGGKGRESTIRAYTDKKGQMREFRAMYGFLTNGRQHVVVIWDIENEDIARYIANPNIQDLRDPFYNFKPFEREGIGGMYDSRAYGRDGRRLSINLGGRRPIGAYPANEYVDDVIGNDNNQRQERQ